MQAIRLKTEHLFNPIGIDVHAPKLSWNCNGPVNSKQTAYQIIAKDAFSGNVLWDSRKVQGKNGDDMSVAWGGAPVPSSTKVEWKVGLWGDDCDDNTPSNSEPTWAHSATFETGIDPNQWQAQWITGNYTADKTKRYPVDCFKREFEVLQDCNLPSARLYITACGLYEAKINGVRVGSFVMAPGYTDYRKRIQYQTYDVSRFLTPGTNTIEVWLADGWYRGCCGAWGLKNQYGTQTKFLAQLQLIGNNHKAPLVVSDSSWSWSSDGPITFADNKDGEVVNANKTPTYAGNAVVVDQNPTNSSNICIPTCSNNVPVEEHERFDSPKIIKTPAGKTVLDFKQNVAGYIEFEIPQSLKLNGGEQIKLRFGELIDDTGEFTQTNIQVSNKKKTKISPLQQVIYTCKPGLNTYKTKFAVFGFQYVQIEALNSQAQKIIDNISSCKFCAIAVYSSIEETGSFECSNTLLNKFVDCTRWSTKNNSLDIPTDCPTRERHGWSGDAQIFCSTAGYLFDFEPFAKKYLVDLYDWQTSDGKLPQIAPEGGTDSYMKSMNGSAGWADAGIIMPYVLWQIYADTDVIRTFLPGMRKYAKYVMDKCGKTSLYSQRLGLKGDDKKYACNYGQAYGEWAEPVDVHAYDIKDFIRTKPEVSTAYTVYVLELLAKMERELGQPDNLEHAKLYSDFATKSRKSYQAIRHSKKNLYPLDTDRQASLVRPLAFCLLDDVDTKYAKDRLIKALENYGWRLGTGFLSTPLILDVLATYNLDAAYKLLENEDLPGWLCMSKAGATTIWENWEGPTDPNTGCSSLDHYSKGACVRWLFDTMCGIKVDPTSKNHFIIEPHPGGSFTYANATYTSIYGKVTVAWNKNDDETYSYDIQIPPNCTADIKLPE